MEELVSTPKDKFDDFVQDMVQKNPTYQERLEQLETEQMINYLWGPNGKITQENAQKNLEEAAILSQSSVTVRYNTRKKEKSNGTLKKAAIYVVAGAMIFSLGARGVKAVQNKVMRNDIVNELSIAATGNKLYGDYNTETEERTWWYEIDDMARDVLNNNQSYDIDTRIYGCYCGLSEYNKFTHMDELFWKMKSIVYAAPENYTQDVIDVVSTGSFSAYLADKGLDVESWAKIMEQILVAYGNQEKDSEKLQSLLQEFGELGTRNGGGR